MSSQDRRQGGDKQGNTGIALVVKTKSPPRSNGSHRTFTTAEESDSNDSNDAGGCWEDSALLPKRNSALHEQYNSNSMNPLGRYPADVEEGNFRQELQHRWGWKNPLHELIPNKQNRAVLMLNIVAVIWGSQHAIIKTVVTDSDPAAFTFLRFGLAGLVASPYLPGFQSLIRWLCTTIKTAFQSKSPNQNIVVTKEERIAEEASGEQQDGGYDDCRKKFGWKNRFWNPWRWGIEMGFWMFLGFAFQAIGMQTTTAQRSGFLLYLNVKFVPFFAYLLLGRHISMGTWVSAFAAFSGTAMLAIGGDNGDAGGAINTGDLWSIAAAAASGMFILRLEMASAAVPRSSELNATSLVAVAAFSGIWSLVGGGPKASSSVSLFGDLLAIAVAHPIGLLYLSVVSTALANLLQTKAQRDVPAERASVVYSLDPVYGAVFSWAILGETLGGVLAYVGASIIFVAAAANSLAAATASSAKPAAPEDGPPPQPEVSSSSTTLFSSDAVTASNQ